MEGAITAHQTADRRYARVAEKQAEYAALSPKELSKKIKQLEHEMYEHAKNLEFEEAARVRDELTALQDGMMGV